LILSPTSSFPSPLPAQKPTSLSPSHHTSPPSPSSARAPATSAFPSPTPVLHRSLSSLAPRALHPQRSGGGDGSAPPPDDPSSLPTSVCGKSCKSMTSSCCLIAGAMEEFNRSCLSAAAVGDAGHEVTRPALRLPPGLRARTVAALSPSPSWRLLRCGGAGRSDPVRDVVSRRAP
ncbi:unnamed protein product, partial [Urochloa humidicola]